ncbi:hypothetical protein QJJ93_000911 [Staphylococcus pseudintermedius]|uniref:hypothetical protein n=1 Tax=Staphylococcus pseudintermedius TaxID=283734 RepID=UPI001654E25B|nr:hypothetical protein [Staphylococcus pseudintermedius]EGQ1281258.1 hypothetical protein [Staphylococcus pseudintermedius]EGQ1310060.1 hypothetical protein [Staphylococcus pseudintermedius]EGQ1656998.1 hypothetical protein [Staphylococcus pseudintermedius]EGQ2670757.1 hypothetical protein [Staphylococcus pseudintermedius]EGQ2802262.1 hypothetical protein [Staphylococcus pseudintermedius]
MKIKQAINDVQSMSQDGDAILRSLQNKSMPVIDLLVRESLQNSLDATLPEAKETKVDFILGEFNSSTLASYFEGISEQLTSRFNSQADFIAIKDSNTTGLTGDYKSTDAQIVNKSNFFKLVFGIGKNQEMEGAGGSWGLGKTSYFRIGIGIVIYYTRVKNVNGYEERLIASLIESPKQKFRLLPENDRGIAWWGEYENDESSQLLPLTESDDIKEILNIFNIERYKEDETGTTIIVPYIGENELFIENKESIQYPWEMKRKDAIKLAVQRWYMPRLNNDKYREVCKNSILNCTVSGETFIKGVNTEPTFDLFQDLYNSAATGKAQKENITVKEIFLKRNAMRNPSKTPVGKVAFCEVGKEEMKMMPPDNKFSPLAYIGSKDENKVERNSSIVIAYTRKPGMIIEYNLDGEWSPNKANILNEETNLFGFFVPNSTESLIEKYEQIGYSTLEQYLRATENADHASWIDEDGFGIIRRIKEYTAKQILAHYTENNSEKQTTATSGLSRKFGNLLMPKRNFGKSSSSRMHEERKHRNVGNRNRVSDIRVIESNPIDETNVEVRFKASIQKASLNRIFIQILSQEKKITKKVWSDSISTNTIFPFEIEDLIIESIDAEKYGMSFIDFKDPHISFQQEDKSEIFIETTLDRQISIEGKLLLKMRSSEFIPSIAISSENEKAEEKL